MECEIHWSKEDILDFVQIVLTFHWKVGADLWDWYNMNSLKLDQQILSATNLKFEIQLTIVHLGSEEGLWMNENVDCHSR